MLRLSTSIVTPCNIRTSQFPFTMVKTRRLSSEPTESPPTKRARTKKIKTLDEPLRPRIVSPWKLGAHVSAAGGVENAVTNAVAIGANAFALFLKSQRKWSSPEMKESSILAFKERMAQHQYDPKHVLPHGSYLINLGNPDVEKREKSYQCFVDDLKRCAQLGLVLYNFHPGSTVGEATPSESMAHIADSLNRAHKDESTGSVITVLENMAGAGNIIGGDFSHLKEIIDGVDDKTRVGVCLDTCHMFAAGYDIRTKEGWEETMSKFDTQVGLNYLKAIHLNDSKTTLASHRDRHENIGIGHIGFAAFRHILSDLRVQNIPIVLETPSFEKPVVWATEIEMLQENMQDSDQPDKWLNLSNTIWETVKSVSGDSSTRVKKPAAKKATRGRKKKRAEDDKDEDEDEDEEGLSH